MRPPTRRSFTQLLLGGSLLVTVDRIEGDLAVVEWGDAEHTDVPLALLPAGVHEGDHLRVRWQRTRAPFFPLLKAPRSVVPPPPPHERDCAPKESPC